MWCNDRPYPPEHGTHAEQAMPCSRREQLRRVDVDAAEGHADAELAQHVQGRHQPDHIWKGRYCLHSATAKCKRYILCLYMMLKVLLQNATSRVHQSSPHRFVLSKVCQKPSLI